jgi:hypothetical protein
MSVLGQPQRCTCCGETGHNRTTCTRSSHKEVPFVFADTELFVADDALPCGGAARGASSEYLGVTKVGDGTWRANAKDGRKSETRGFSSETEAATWFAAHPFNADRDQRLEDESPMPMTGRAGQDRRIAVGIHASAPDRDCDARQPPSVQPHPVSQSGRSGVWTTVGRGGGHRRR